MSTFRPEATDYMKVQDGNETKKVLKTEAFEKFNSALLGLGDITETSDSIDAIAAVFDLQGFTNFCKQIQPHLSVPVFLSEFLAWLFDQLRKEMSQKTFEEGVALWSPLPFYVKFMGDGLLVLWDASSAREAGRRNIIVSCRQICAKYSTDLYPRLSRKVVDAPPILRCGIARGAVYSVGNGNDFVGSSINMAARLEKIPGATFAVNARGFKLDDPKATGFFKTTLIVKKMAIRGIGDGELIALIKSEYENMKASDKKHFRDA